MAGGLSNEQGVQNRIRLALGTGPVRLFRNNTGAFKDPRTGQLVRFGLCKGSSDLIGWRSVTITPDMVGQTLAVFTAIEVKDRGRATDDQLRFVEVVKRSGGFAGIARTIEEARKILGL